MRGAAALALVVVAAATAHAEDRRVAVDPNEPPWNAIAKVQSNIGEHCSGVLVAPAVVVTAAPAPEWRWRSPATTRTGRSS